MKQRHARWRRWIEQIAAEASEQDIIDHIRKHCTVDLDRDLAAGKPEHLVNWVASTFNLLAIFQQQHLEVICDTPDLRDRMLDRLRKKWEESPTNTVPPP